MWARSYWSPKHLLFLGGAVVAGFLVELAITVLLKAEADQVERLKHVRTGIIEMIGPVEGLDPLEKQA
jgi:hypothetical protein